MNTSHLTFSMAEFVVWIKPRYESTAFFVWHVSDPTDLRDQAAGKYVYVLSRCDLEGFRRQICSIPSNSAPDRILLARRTRGSNMRDRKRTPFMGNIARGER